MIITLMGADFSASNIGTLSSWRISRSLGGGATYSGPVSVDKGAALNATVTLAEGYEIGTAGVTITMGGTVLSGAHSISGNVITITIASVTGNVLIKVPTVNTATGEEDGGTGDEDETPLLPTGYQQVEYIQTDGTQYFALSGTKISSNATYELKFATDRLSNGGLVGLIGAYSSTAEAARSQIRVWDTTITSTNKVVYGFEFMYGNTGNVENSTAETDLISVQYWDGVNTIKVDANKLYWNDELVKTHSAQSFSKSATDFTLFAQNNNNPSGAGGFGRISSVKCYSVKITDTTNNIHKELIPCYRTSDNVIGLYDVINSEFILPTAGTISTKGSNV